MKHYYKIAENGQILEECPFHIKYRDMLLIRKKNISVSQRILEENTEISGIKIGSWACSLCIYNCSHDDTEGWVDCKKMTFKGISKYDYTI
jgi:hypothetical protein